MSASNHETNDAGFSLLEVIIAFTVLSISLAIGVQTISSGANTFKRATLVSNISFAIDELWVQEIRKINTQGSKSGELPRGIKWQYVSTQVPDQRSIPIYSVAVQITSSETWEGAYKFTYFVGGKP